MGNNINRLLEALDKIALNVVMVEHDDIPAMGELLNEIVALDPLAKELNDPKVDKLLIAVGGYTQALILDEADDVKPLEGGITTLQEICRAHDKGEVFKGNITTLLKSLHATVDEEFLAGTDEEPEGVDVTGLQPDPPEEIKTSVPAEVPASKPTQEYSEEDVQILRDFVIESLDNLESIEINLVDLEQDPTNSETINAIFRPFHTIKGVSGFLSLGKINRLSHSTENLLDSARQGDFLLSDEIVDVILESVDMLKKAINGLERAIISGSDLEAGIEVDSLIARINQTGELAKSDKMPLGERLVEKGKIRPEDLQIGLNIQKGKPEQKLGRILVEQKLSEPKEVIGALRDQKRGKRLTDMQVKVDTDKLDNLVDQTGEMVIAQAMLRQNSLIQSLNNQQLFQNLNQLTQIVSGLQKTAMSMRMVPIKNTFQKMVRLVRDLARSAGKDVALEMFGEETEIDRNVVEELYEPMVHMIRNACDHGIELPAERKAAGKNPKGTIQLRAFHKGGNIVIEIEDDGKGLNKKRIIDKAISTGLITGNQELTDKEIFNLIWHPGFSTAKEITDVSGRGVGMDVVRSAIEKLRGHIDLYSETGKGSTVVISLPLTLAIIEGMLVRVGKERYIVPTMAILESFKPKKDDYHTVTGKGEMVMARGQLIPMLRLSKMFNVKADSENPEDGLIVVVENKDERRGLLLDELLGQEEIVIKSLGSALKSVKGLAGGAILGDGLVGLILDMAGLFEVAMNFKK
ncbi:MAG: chemotaxis protein CheA [Desulfobacterales bacterium]|nr:chemotaxis protein CheA [Desulfobacterales bacterium]